VRFDVTVPCKECPFRRRGKGAVRLTANRVRDVAGNMLNRNGASFSCHKAVHGSREDPDYRPSPRDIHCVGALIFAERNKSQTFAMQIAERLGLYNPDQFRSIKQRRLIFASIEEMLKTALPGRR
jgi:hypothetical protein